MTDAGRPAGPLHVGVDFGSTGLRAAWTVDGEQGVLLDHEMDEHIAWLRCARSSASLLGVTFPSLKDVLGTRSPGADVGREQVTRALTGARREIAARTSRPVGSAVICVPATYPTSQREALHDAATDAGFSAAYLVNDSVAAATAVTAASASPATVLVLGAGYRGVELGLSRVAKGRVRMLAYQSSPIAGADLDEYLLASVDDAVAERGWSWRGGQDARRWMLARADAQAAKEQLARADEAVFAVDVTGPSGRHTPVTVTIPRRGFDEVIRRVFTPLVHLLRELLVDADVSRDEIDTVVLTGGSTRIPALRSLITAATGHTPALMTPALLATGAALQAASLSSESGSALVDAGRVVDTPREPVVSEVGTDALRTSITLRDEAGAASDAGPVARPTTESLESYVRELAADGEYGRARTELGDLIRTAQKLLDGLPSDAATRDDRDPTSPAYRSQLALSTARTCLARGEYARAVSESHYAWRLGSDDPTMLDQMIDVHCEAATANSRPDQYEDAIHWLRCALGHDETNARTRSLLAERHFLQAQDLRRRRRPDEALAVVDECLHWDPAHVGALELQRDLAGR